MQNKWLILIVGPTAVGKTSLSIKLAKHFKTEIISADSRQFFKEISIGTAKPNLEELNAVKHHFINSISIKDYYSAGDFERDADALLTSKIFKLNNFAVAVGGSGLYTKALLHGLDEMPEVDQVLRDELTKKFQLNGIAPLKKKLLELNPEKLAQIDQNNPQRLMRAIELSVQEVKLGSKPKAIKNYTILPIGLNMDREKLYNQINLRVDLMMEEGLLEEAKKVHPHKHLNALQTVGYAELFDYFEKKLTLIEAVDKIKQHTRNYAKKQITWFKKEPLITWFEPTNFDEIVNFIDKKTIVTN